MTYIQNKYGINHTKKTFKWHNGQNRKAPSKIKETKQDDVYENMGNELFMEEINNIEQLVRV